MASTSQRDRLAIEQGMAILSESLERKADLKEFAQNLDESAVLLCNS